MRASEAWSGVELSASEAGSGAELKASESFLTFD